VPAAWSTEPQAPPTLIVIKLPARARRALRPVSSTSLPPGADGYYIPLKADQEIEFHITTDCLAFVWHLIKLPGAGVLGGGGELE